MTDSIWHKEECGPGRSYMLGKDPYIKYDDKDVIIASIVEGLRQFIHAEPAVRLTMDSTKSDAERAVLAIPFESDQDIILLNFAKIIYQSLMGYYISAAPKTTHFGIANLLLEGNSNSLLRREMEKLIAQFQFRSDMAGRLIQNITLVGKQPVPEAGDTFLIDTIKEALDIHVGYRINATGENVNCSQIFLPLQTGSEIINQVYFNIEKILHHNFIAYDETSEGYLKISDTLIFKDLCGLLKRSKDKELTRNKILNDLQFDAITKRDSEEERQLLIGDKLYDMLNNIQDTKLKEATDRSRDLYAACMKSLGASMSASLTARAEKTQIDIAAIPETEMASDLGSGTLPPPVTTSAATETATATAAPLPDRPFKRKAPPTGDGSRRRKFQKVALTKDELSAGSAQVVPEPPKENLRVPAPRKTRRITRTRPEEVGAATGKE